MNSALCLLVSALCALLPQGPLEGPSPEFVAYNRYSILGVGDQGTQWLHPLAAVQSKINGALPLQDPAERLAFRFTMPETFKVTRSVDALWVYYRTIGEPGVCSLSLREFDPLTGQPSGTSTTNVPFFPHEPTAQPGWHRVALPQSFDVLRGAAYYLVVQPEDDNFNPLNRLDFVHLRARMPVPFLPYDSRDPGGSLRAPYDAEVATVRDGLAQCGWVRWQAPVRNYVPIFLVEHDVDRDPTKFTKPEFLGQPYDRHIEQTIADKALYGQAFSVPADADLDINYVAMFVRGAGQSGLPNCQTGATPCNSRPCGDLLLEVFEDGVAQPLTTKVLVQGQLSGGTNPIYRARSHWFGVSLDQTLTLGAGKLYYLMLSSPQSGDANALDCHDANGDGWDGWTFSAQSSSLELPAVELADLPTYRGTESFAVRATRTQAGAAEFTPLDSFRSDTGFLLGNFPKQRPIAILDEAGGNSLVCQTLNTRATAGESMNFIAGNRNIGTAAGHGEMFARIRHKGIILDTVYYPAISANQESGVGATSPIATLELKMPDLPSARFLLEFGWVDPSLPPPFNHIVDDRVPADTRRTLCCVCQQSAPCGSPLPDGHSR